MQVPKALESTWAQVSQNGSVSKEGYNKLLREANTVIDKTTVNTEVVNFLKGLNSQLSKSTDKEGSVPVTSVINFSGDLSSPFVSSKNIGDVPENLKQEWSKFTSDNKVTTEEYTSLLQFVKSEKNFVLSPQDQDFLKNLQVLILASKDKEIKISDNAGTQNKPDVKEVPTKIINKEPEVKTTPKGKDDVVPKEVPQKTVPEQKRSYDKQLKAENIEVMNELKSLLDKIGDNPELSPLKSIVDKRIGLNDKLSSFSKKVNDTFSSIKDGGDIKKLQDARSVLQKEYESLGDIKDLKDPKELFQDVMGYVDSEIGKVNSKKPASNTTKTDKPVLNGINKPKDTNKSVGKPKTDTNIPFVENDPAPTKPSDKIAVPKTLKAEWDKSVKNGKLSLEAMNNLFKVAAPNDKAEELDNDEKEFLQKVYSKFVNEDNTEKPEIDVSNLQESKPVEKKPAQEKANTTASKVPEAFKGDWDKITKDGDLTVDEFNSFVQKAKTIIDKRSPSADELAFIKGFSDKMGALYAKGQEKLILNASEQPKPVEKPQEKANTTTSKVPEAFKGEWDKITKDGDLTVDEFNSFVQKAKTIIDKRSPSADELAFIKGFSDKMGALYAKGQEKLILNASEQPKPVEKKQPVNKTQDKPASTASKVPEAFKGDWDKITKDGDLTADEFNSFVQKAKDLVSKRDKKDLTPDELNFIKAFSEKMNDLYKKGQEKLILSKF